VVHDRINAVGMISTEAGLSVQNAVMKVQWYGLLLSLHLSPHHPSHLTASTNPMRHVPPIPEVYISLLSAQCFISLCNGLTGYMIPLYNTLAVQKPLMDHQSLCMHQARSTCRCYLNPSPPVWACRQVHVMVNAGWPVLLRLSLLPSHH